MIRHSIANLLEPAEAPHAARLERAQQLRLQHARQVVDFVEEQRPRPGELEEALLARVRSGERAALVAEQLRLEKRFGNRRAIDRDERLVGRGARVVDAAREQLLARSRLADQQNRRATRSGHLRREPDRFAKQRAGADDVLKPEGARAVRRVGRAIFTVEQPEPLAGVGVSG